MQRSMMTLALLTSFAFVGCNTQQKTEEMVMLRIDAAKAKTLQAETDELKKTNEALREENQQLKLEVATLKAKGATTATLKPLTKIAKAPTRSSNAEKPSPAEIDTAREQVTGGGSFK